jgi:transposase
VARLPPLESFPESVRDAREYKRALVVQLCECGHQVAEVARLLQVSEAFVSTCRKRYAQDGVSSFSLGYRGGSSRLSDDERAETLTWIAAQDRPNVAKLQTYRESTQRSDNQ